MRVMRTHLLFLVVCTWALDFNRNTVHTNRVCLEQCYSCVVVVCVYSGLDAIHYQYHTITHHAYHTHQYVCVLCVCGCLVSVTCLEKKKPGWQKARILHLSTQLEESLFLSKESMVRFTLHP